MSRCVADMAPSSRRKLSSSLRVSELCALSARLVSLSQGVVLGSDLLQQTATRLDALGGDLPCAKGHRHGDRRAVKPGESTKSPATSEGPKTPPTLLPAAARPLPVPPHSGRVTPRQVGRQHGDHSTAADQQHDDQEGKHGLAVPSGRPPEPSRTAGPTRRPACERGSTRCSRSGVSACRTPWHAR